MNRGQFRQAGVRLYPELGRPRERHGSDSLQDTGDISERYFERLGGAESDWARGDFIEHVCRGGDVLSRGAQRPGQRHFVPARARAAGV